MRVIVKVSESKVFYSSLTYQILSIIFILIWTPNVAAEMTIIYANSDAYTIEGDATNYGNENELFVTQAHGSFFTSERKSFIGGFEIESIPSNATIESATLFLFGARVSSGSGVELAVQIAIDPWTENGINWNNMPDRLYNANSSTNFVENLSLMKWHTWDVKVYVEQWFNGIIPNNGFALIALDNNSAAQFVSTESDPILKPYIEVTFSTPQNTNNPVWLNQYFPLMVNNSWTFGNSITISVDGTKTIDKVLAKRVYRSDLNAYILFGQDQEGTRRFEEEVPSQGVFGVFEPPLKELSANAFIGDTYSYSSTEKIYNSSGILQGEISVGFTTDVQGYEDVTLPTPAFINGNQYSFFPNCLKVFHTVTGNGSVFQETSWYAKDLGFVKLSSNLGTFYITSASTYSDGGLSGTWQGQVLDSQGVHIGDLDLILSQIGSNINGIVKLNMNNKNTYSLPIQNAYASGPNAVGNASDGTNNIDFAFVHKGNSLTGPYNSNIFGYGSVAPIPASIINDSDNSGDSTSNGGGGGGGCFVMTSQYQ